MGVHDDTIAAIATASGAAGLAVVRVSGPRAVAIADAVFRGASRLADASGNTLHHGWAVEREGKGELGRGPGEPGEPPARHVRGAHPARPSLYETPAPAIHGSAGVSNAAQEAPPAHPASPTE